MPHRSPAKADLFRPLPESDDPQIRQHVEFARVASIHDSAGQPLVASFIFVAVVTVLLQPLVPPALLWAWVGWRVLIAALRLSSIHAFRQDPSASRRARHWGQMFVLLLAPDALAWGLMPVLFMPYVDANGAMLLFAGAIGVTAVGAFTNWHHRLAGITFVALVIAPSAIDQMLRHGRIGVYVGISLTLYLLLLAIEVVRAQTQLDETMRLRFGYALLAEQRRAALDLAEAASAAKTRFMAAVSHEIRTPLNGVVGMTELLRRTQDAAMRGRRLDVLHQSANHLQAVVNDLIDLARLDVQRLVLRPEPVSPASLVNDVAGLLSALAEGKGLELRQRVDGAVPPAVLADPARVRQVLFNLVGNALKFTHQGHVALSVTASPGGVPGRLRFTVSDTGEGIPPESVDRVFEAFEQAGPEAASRQAGAGLGLTISRQLAQAMGGDIHCRSVLGEGTTFEFDLCAPACEPPQRMAEPAVSAATVAPAADAPIARVLVADDNPINALVAEGMLEQLGIPCEVARDGQQALAKLEQSSFGLVLMDCMMPTLDGYEATRRWRALEDSRKAARLPIVALTANAVAGDREACLAAGMDDYLAKPFTLAELSKVLGRHMPVPARPQRTAA